MTLAGQGGAPRERSRDSRRVASEARAIQPVIAARAWSARGGMPLAKARVMGRCVWLACGLAVAVAACSSGGGSNASGGWDAGEGGAGEGGGPSQGNDGGVIGVGPGDASAGDAPITTSDGGSAEAGPHCTTHITYGSAWDHGSGHPAQTDDVTDTVTWDGVCTDDGTSSYAVLSNGWKPYFQGNGACELAFDYAGTCAEAKGACTTRIAYGSAWLPPANHPATYDDVPGRVFSDGVCTDSGSDSYAGLSNGWNPYFQGSGACRVSFRYTQCGGLYTNAVIPFDCPDPGVLADAGQYVLSCTSGDAADAYPLFSSPDLVSWSAKGHIFPAGSHPAWATADFWAPEVHKVGGQYVAYFTARHTSGRMAVGAATATSPLGPFTDIGHPVLLSSTSDLIDPNEINASNGTSYLVWKDDASATGSGGIVIRGQPLAADGLSVTGGSTVLIGVDQSWEGPLVEAPFMVEHGGTFSLFYSANPYDTTAYAIGVAQSSSPLGPFTKGGGPILGSVATWSGPGHCSVVDTPAGDTYMVFHAWEAGHVGNGNGPGRLVLTDAVEWPNGWPTVPFAPSAQSRPLP